MTCGNGSVASPFARLAATAAALRPNPRGDRVMYATKLAMQTLGRRVLDIDANCAGLDDELAALVTATAPSLAALHGVGTNTAALLLVAAGDNAERVTSVAAFAHLCVVAPIHTSSGKTTRHRLNRGGNRQANHALWRIVLTRMESDPRTRAYVERRTIEGRSKPEIMRVLKRYVAREVYRHLPRVER
jgi:transposase